MGPRVGEDGVGVSAVSRTEVSGDEWYVLSTASQHSHTVRDEGKLNMVPMIMLIRID